MRHRGPKLPPIGVLLIDDDGSRIQCHVCGDWYINLAQHAYLKHGLPAHMYKEQAGLNHSTKLMSPNYRDRIREKSLPLIAKLRSEGKLRRWHEDKEKLADDKKAAIQTLRLDGIRPEGILRRKASFTPERRKAIGERTRARNLTGKHRAAPEAISAGVRKQAGATPRVCKTCGEAYTATATRQVFCPPCGKEARRATWREFARKKRETRRSQPARDGVQIVALQQQQK